MGFQILASVINVLFKFIVEVKPRLSTNEGGKFSYNVCAYAIVRSISYTRCCVQFTRVHVFYGLVPLIRLVRTSLLA